MVKKIIFALFIVLGIFFRLWQLGALPGGLFLDEINMAVDAKNLAEHGTDQYGRTFPFYFEDATDFKLPGYIYLATVSYKVFGNTILSMHFPSALAGILSIFLIGILAKMLFPEKKYFGLIASSVLAISPFAIHFSRISYETNIALACMLVFLISLIHVLKNVNPNRWLIIGSIAIFVADWTYPSPRVVIPLFTLLLLIASYFLKFAGIQKKNIVKSLIFIIVVALTFTPTIFFPFADARQFNLVTLVDTQGATPLQSLLLKSQSILVSYIRLWNVEFLFDKGDLFAYRHGTKELGVFLSIFLLPFILGFGWAIRQITRKNFSLFFILLFALVAGLPSALSSEFPYGTRVLVMLIPYTIFIALGVDLLFAWIGKQKRIVQTVTIVFLSVILVYQLALFAFVYFVDFKSTSLPEFPTAQVSLAKYVDTFHAHQPQTRIYFLSDRSCNVWGNDALNLWYFGNLPNKEMVSWNNTYRNVRYADKNDSPFEAYDKVTIPSAFISAKNLYLFSGYPAQDKAPSGSLLIRCGYTLNSFNKKTESLVKVFYEDERTLQTPSYVVTVKK